MTDTNDANDADMERRDSAFKWLLILGVNACAATVALIGVRDPPVSDWDRLPEFALTMAWLAAAYASVSTLYHTFRGGEPPLAWPRRYRAAMAGILAAAVSASFAGGGTVVLGFDGPPLGFVCTAALNLAVAVLAWRALTRPSPRRAAAIGVLAVLGGLAALIGDILLAAHSGWSPDQIAHEWLTLFPAIGLLLFGGVASLLALCAFAPVAHLPAARATTAP